MQSIMDRLDIESTATSQCCPTCDTRLEKRISNFKIYSCPGCGKEHHGYDLAHAVLPEFAPLTDEKIARALTYYHWTIRENWTEELPNDVIAHLGCTQAAYERMRDERRTYGTPSESPEGYVYTVTINEDTPFYPSLSRDEEDPDSEAYGSYAEISDGYVDRYVNVIEAPGSISLCADKTMFTVVNRVSAREFFGDKAMDAATERGRATPQ